MTPSTPASLPDTSPTASIPKRELLTVVSQADQMGARAKPLDWKISRRVVQQMLRYRKLFFLILTYAILLALLNGGLPHLAGLVIAGPVVSPDEFEMKYGMTALRGIVLGAIGVALLAVLWTVIMRARFIAVARMAEYVAHDLRVKMFDHLQNLSMDFFDKTKVGWIIARGGGDIDQIRQAVSQVIPRTVIALLQMAYAMVAIGLYDWVMLAILAGIAPIVYLINWYFRRRLSMAHRNTRASFSRLTANLAESVSGMRITQAFVREKVNTGVFHKLCLNHRTNHIREAKASGIYVPTLDLAGQVFVVIVLLVGGWRVQENLMSIGALIGVMLMTRPFFSPITVMGEMYNVTLQAMAGGERVFNLLDTKAGVKEPVDPQPLPHTSDGAKVEFKNVTFEYVPETPVLNDISFTANPGETIAIVGHTGAGKTTIASLIAKYYEHQRGSILIDGISIKDIASSELHQHTAMVQQHNFLFEGTVFDNIRFTRPDASDEDVRQVCKELDCLDVLESLPRGLHTDVGERGEALSLGQRQLVCFARALMARPRILLLDEATSAIDAVTEQRVQRALARLLEGRTSFVVAHRLSTIRHADLVLVMDHGKIIERGTHDELMQVSEGVYAELYEEFVRLSTGE